MSRRVLMIILQIKLTEVFAATIHTIKYSDFGFLLYKNIAYKIPDNPMFKSKSGLNPAPGVNNKNPSIFVIYPAANATTGPNKNAIAAKKINPKRISNPMESGIISSLFPIIVSAISTAVRTTVRTFLKLSAISEIPSAFKIFLILILPFGYDIFIFTLYPIFSDLSMRFLIIFSG
jgi:hypothetical protein